MTRRAFFAAIAGAFAAAVAPKPLCFPNHAIVLRKAAHFDEPTGLTIRMIRTYDGEHFFTRFDVVNSWAAEPEMCAVILS